MKRFLFVFTFGIFIMAAFFSAAPLRASADTASSAPYAVAADNDVWFYSEPDEASGLFLVPLSYYVKVIDSGQPFCKVEYGDGVSLPRITGYCKTESLTPVDFIPVRPFLLKQVTLTYTLSGTDENEFDSLQKDFYYYGSTFRGTARYWYVYADGKYGFVAQNKEPEYELNVDYLTVPTAKPGDNDSSPEQPAPAMTGVQIALVCVAVGVILAIAAIMFLTRKTPPVHREESEDFL